MTDKGHISVSPLQKKSILEVHHRAIDDNLSSTPKGKSFPTAISQNSKVNCSPPINGWGLPGSSGDGDSSIRKETSGFMSPFSSGSPPAASIPDLALSEALPYSEDQYMHNQTQPSPSLENNTAQYHNTAEAEPAHASNEKFQSAVDRVEVASDLTIANKEHATPMTEAETNVVGDIEQVPQKTKETTPAPDGGVESVDLGNEHLPRSQTNPTFAETNLASIFGGDSDLSSDEEIQESNDRHVRFRDSLNEVFSLSLRVRSVSDASGLDRNASGEICLMNSTPRIILISFYIVLIHGSPCLVNLRQNISILDDSEYNDSGNCFLSQ